MMESDSKNVVIEQEAENKKYFARIIRLQSVILFIYTFVFMLYIASILFGINKDKEFISVFSNLLLGFSVCYILCWLLSMPFRWIMYQVSIKKGTLNQKLSTCF